MRCHLFLLRLHRRARTGSGAAGALPVRAEQSGGLPKRRLHLDRLFDLLFRNTEMKVSRAGQLALLSLHFVGHVEFQEFQLNGLEDMSFHSPS